MHAWRPSAEPLERAVGAPPASPTASGRERRRRGLINGLRRLIYSLLLWYCNKAPASTPAGAEAIEPPLMASIAMERVVDTAGEPAYRVDLTTADPRIPGWAGDIASQIRTRSWHFQEEWLRVRGGVGFDLALPDTGNLHLNLLPGRRPEEGLRWQLAADPSVTPRLWSLGGTVEAARPARAQPLRVDGPAVEARPQLLFDLDQLTGMSGNAQLTVQHGRWRDPDRRVVAPERVWQVSLSWKF